MKSIILDIILDRSYDLNEIWIKIYEILNKNTVLRKTYNTLYNGSRKCLSEKSIDSYLRYESNDEYFSLSDKSGLRKQWIHYFPKKRDIKIIIPSSEITTDLKLIQNLISQNFKFSTFYFRSEGEEKYVLNSYASNFFETDKSNLYMRPALSNYRDFYIEGVSAEMWFGESFWQYASCSREEVITCDWLKTEEKENGVLYVKAYYKPFDSREGEQLAIQRRLLKLLFNIDENRPHGYEPTGAKPKTFVQKAYTDGQTAIVGDLKEQSE